MEGNVLPFTPRIRSVSRIAAALVICATGGAIAGASLPTGSDASTPAHISLTATAGATVTVPVGAASGLPAADLNTFRVTTSPKLGVVSASGDTVAYTAPAVVPAASITAGRAVTAAQLPAATIQTVAVPTAPVPATPTASPTPVSTPAPTASPTSPATPEPTPEPTSITTAEPEPEPEPTVTAEPEPSSNPDIADEPPTEAAPDTEARAAPLTDTGSAARTNAAKSQHPASTFTYTVCAAGGGVCTAGTADVTFLPTALHPGSQGVALIERGQTVVLPMSRWFTATTGADPASFAARSRFGAARVDGQHVTYTATKTGTDVITADLCPAGAPKGDCVTGTLTVSVVAPYRPAPNVEQALTTDSSGVAKFTIPPAPGSGPAAEPSYWIETKPDHGHVSVNGGRFTYQAVRADFTGSDRFAYRACGVANRDHCSVSTVTINANDGFGWATTPVSVHAGITTAVHARTWATDAEAWGLDDASVTLTGPSGVAVRRTAPAAFTVTAPGARTSPFAVTVCGTGKNDVRYCASATVTVKAVTVLPTSPTVPKVLSTPTAGDLQRSTPTKSAAAPIKQSANNGTDITWWVIGGALLFALGGGATTFKGRRQ